MQEEAQQQQGSYSEEAGDAQQPTEGTEQEQQPLESGPISSEGRIGFIGAGQVHHSLNATTMMQ